MSFNQTAAIIKPDVPCSSSWACFLWETLPALAMHACKSAYKLACEQQTHFWSSLLSLRKIFSVGEPTGLSLTGRDSFSEPQREGAGHSLIWRKICASEQGLVSRVLSLKHVIQFHFLASWIRGVILDKRLLKECNGSREAVYIQTWYQNVFPQNL